MLSSPPSSPVPPMLTNFRKRFLDPCRSHPAQEQQPFLSLPEAQADALDNEYPGRTNDLVAPQHCTQIAISEMVHIPYCSCAFCFTHPETGDVVESICTTAQPHTRSPAHYAMPSFRSIMEVLYPPSYLGISSPFPDPPSYSRSDYLAHPRDNDQRASLSVSSTTTNTAISQSYLDPLAQDPCVTGVPSPFPGISPSGVLLGEPNPSIVDVEGDILEEPLPAYSPLDQRRPRYPTASDTVGPYPSMSVLRRCTR